LAAVLAFASAQYYGGYYASPYYGAHYSSPLVSSYGYAGYGGYYGYPAAYSGAYYYKK